jgi:hypothetical protein
MGAALRFLGIRCQESSCNLTSAWKSQLCKAECLPDRPPLGGKEAMCPLEGCGSK